MELAPKQSANSYVVSENKIINSMKEYIKKFESVSDADGYSIADIPFTSTIVGVGALINLVCNEENKKIAVDGQGNASIVDAGIPNDEIWYTSSDGKIVTPYTTSSLPEIDTNTYSDGKWIIKFKTDVTSIGERAFVGSRLTSVTIPNSVTSIGRQAFGGCLLTSVTISNSVTNIGEDAFTGCGGLTSVIIPNSVTSIGNNAFTGCGGLTSVIIPNSVTSIGNNAFKGCSGLTSVVWNAKNCADLWYSTAPFHNISSQITSFTFGNEVEHIPAYLCNGMYNLTSVTIPNSVTSIGDCAFEGCSGLTSVTIGNSVTSIGYYAFAYCTGLTSVTIPNSVTSIGENTFWDGVEYAEGYSGSLQTITVGETVYTYDGKSEYFTITLGNGTDVDLMMWTSSCFLQDTEITLSDGSKKQVKDITYDDKLKVWNFDEGNYDEGEIAWLTKVGLKNNHYYQLTFSDGTILKTTGVHSNHKVYCTDTNKFEGVAYIEVGAHVFTENGIVTITDKQYIEEEVEYYNLITKQHFNCFANGVLTSDRYGNIYPIGDDMIFIKNGRPIRPYSEFESVGIKRYWYDTLRLGENTETIDETRKYITKLEVQMRPIE